MKYNLFTYFNLLKKKMDFNNNIYGDNIINENINNNDIDFYINILADILNRINDENNQEENYIIINNNYYNNYYFNNI